jgi:hypothetical protein
MSLVAFKNKSVIQYGSNRSGKPPGGYFVSQGPFGTTGKYVNGVIAYSPNGFSVNGSYRNVGYIGKSSHMAKSGTPFRGRFPVGNGGSSGTYPTPQPVFNALEANVLGEQGQYVKPPSVSNYGMLAKRFRMAYNNGINPNLLVVKAEYTGNQSDTRSQGMYLHNVTVRNSCITDINQYQKFIGDIKKHGPTLCKTTTAKFKYDDMVRNAPYNKYIYNPEDASTFTLRLQRQCPNNNKPGTNGNGTVGQVSTTAFTSIDYIGSGSAF